jgi:phosphate transport system permease protein
MLKGEDGDGRERRAATAAHRRRPALGDPVFRTIAMASAAFILMVALALVAGLLRRALPAVSAFGWGFLTSTEWNPVTGQFGAASSIFGTLVSSALAMLIAVPLSLLVAVFLAELAAPRLAAVVSRGIELLAAVPSIIFGMWGLYVFAPFMASHVQPALAKALGFLPLFSGPPMGIGMLTAGIILAFMILPYVSAVMRDVLRMVPGVVKEAAHGLGATTWEVTAGITVRHGMHGLVGAVLLGLGRASGETMAVTFVIGNDHRIAPSLFAAGNSIASTLANEFAEASDPLHLAALVELGLVLLAISLLIQVATQLWLARLRRRMGGS